MRAVVSLLLLVAVRPAAAQTFPLTPADVADSAVLATSMPRLARTVAASYRDSDRARFLDNLFRLQLVAGNDSAALGTLGELAQLRRTRDTTVQGRATNVQYEIYARAMEQHAKDGSSFGAAFQRAFRTTLERLDDRTAALVLRAFSLNTHDVEPPLDAAIKARGEQRTIALADALGLTHAYQVAEAYRAFDDIVDPLVAADDQRRYLIATNVQVPVGDGAMVCALIVRPRHGPKRLPTLLQFTIYADTVGTFRESRRSASNQYVAVTGFTRGKLCSSDPIEPYIHDGADAAALIEWIARQPWSDGRVGMYGGSYSGFTQWAAAKHSPQGLRAIIAGASAAPGVDVPMEGNVFWNFVYPWPFYTTDNKTLDDSTYNDFQRWNRVSRDWYVSGRAYRDLDKIDGTPNPVFDDWIAHPSYDAYWQSHIPYEHDFARITIPVLQTAGYYYGGPGAAIYYFSQHYKYDSSARHYLVIGPYDHFQAQRGVVSALGDTSRVISGYTIDPVAAIDIVADLRYQWFDFALKGAPRPKLLLNKVNYEVIGANVWKHAPSISAMSAGTSRLYLSADRSGDSYRLSPQAPSSDTFVAQSVNLADRSDVDRIVPGGGVLDTAVDTSNGLEFVSDSLTAPVEISGLFSAQLDVMTNKRDFDFSIGLYELTSKGKYVQLPPYQARASYVASRTERRLLVPGTRQRLTFSSVRLASQRLHPGSRLVAVFQVIKNPGQQINYGTGKDVSDETLVDAGEPLTIQLFGDSYIDLPVASCTPKGARSSLCQHR